MAACLIILLFVRNELTFDAWMPQADRTFQFQTYYTDPHGGRENNLQMAPYVAQAALRKDFPQIAAQVNGHRSSASSTDSHPAVPEQSPIAKVQAALLT